MSDGLNYNQANYTIRFADVINLMSDEEAAGKTISSEAITDYDVAVDTLQVMPSVNTVIDEEVGSFYTDFVDKYRMREIGTETIELFCAELKRISAYVYNKYYWKLNEYVNKRDTMDDRQVSDSSTHTDTEEGTVSNEYDNYYNPLSTASDNIIGKNTNETDRNITVTRKYSGYKYFGWTKTNAEIMKQILEIQDLYNEALNEFQVLFMGVL